MFQLLASTARGGRVYLSARLGAFKVSYLILIMIQSYPTYKRLRLVLHDLDRLLAEST